MRFYLFSAHGVTHCITIDADQDAAAWTERIWREIFGNGWLVGVIQ
jgi:hypothetical protein